MEDKIKNIKKISADLDYLKDIYEQIKLWGSSPDGDVKFEKLMEWLSVNADDVKHMIDIAEKIKEI